MADFCRDCSIELFGVDCGDLNGLTTPDDAAQGRYAVVICEGCGPIQVDPEGRKLPPRPIGGKPDHIPFPEFARCT